MTGSKKKPVSDEKKKKKEMRETKETKEMNDVRIQRSMPVMEILTILPHSEALLAQYGLSCFHCSANAVETLEQGCMSHGFAMEDIDDLVKDLNELLKDAPLRPQTITLTKDAA